MHLYEGTSPLVQARNRESPRCQPRHGGFCSHRNPDKVSSSDRFFQIPTPDRLERGALPDRFANFFQSVVFTNGGMRYHLINFRLAQVELSFHCNFILFFFHSRFFWNHPWEKFWEILDQGKCWHLNLCNFTLKYRRNLSIIVWWDPILNIFAYSEI